MVSIAALPDTRTGTTRGILFALASYACFSTGDAIIKASSGRFSVFQIAAVLSAFAMVPILVLTINRGGLKGLIPVNRGLVLLRAALVATASLLAWNAFALLPLAEAYALIFGAPMMITAFSAILLREPVGWRRWSAAGVGLVGVLIMLDPSFETLTFGHGLAALAALISALGFILLRRIGRAERSSAVIATTFAVLLLVTAPLAVSQWVWPDASEWFALAMAGLLLGSGQTGMVLSTREAPAAVIAPFQYTQMIWAVLFGLLVFGNEPAPHLFVGLAVVAASGLYIVWRETIRRQPVTLGGGRGETPARVAR